MGELNPDLNDIAKLRIPPRFHGESLESFEAHTDSQRAAIRYITHWLTRIREGKGPMLALVGKQGTGKSHLLYGAARVLFAENRTPFVRPWYALADQLRYGITGNGAERSKDASGVRHDLWNARVVLLDEIRPTAGTNFDDTELAKFACHAYDQQIPVLITTNWNPLAEVVGEAAASRFTQLVIDGPDARQERAA